MNKMETQAAGRDQVTRRDGESEGGRPAGGLKEEDWGAGGGWEGVQGPGGREGNAKEKTMRNTREKLRGRQTSVKSVENDRTGEDVQKSDPHTLQMGMEAVTPAGSGSCSER